MGTVKYSGPVASFHCPTNAEIRSLKVHFSPKQLGEGTPSPENVREIEGWDGVEAYQTGKNIWDEEWESGYLNTTTGLNALTNNQIRAKNYIKLFPNTTYTVNALSKGTIWACFFDSNKIIIKDYSPANLTRSSNVYAISGKTFTTPSNCAYMRFYFTEAYGKIYNKDVMITFGASVELYEPHHGSTTNYEFGVLGKNKFPASDGTTSDIFLAANTTYTISATSPSAGYFKGWYEDETDTGLIWINAGSDGDRRWKTFTPEKNIVKGVIYVGTGMSECQIELGSTPTTYEPYNPNKTVYGGWVDLVSGEVCEEWKSYDLTELSLQQFNIGEKVLTISAFPEKIKSRNAMYCNILPPVSNPNISGVEGVDWNNTRLNICLSTSRELDTQEKVEEWLNDLKTNNITPIIVANTVNSTIYNLPPHSSELKTFLSTNNIWSNADYVEVEYDLHETQTILARKQFIIANQPHIVKPATAPLQSFTTDMAAPLKDCKVGFKPIQDLHGYDKPWVGGSGKNLFNINATEQNPSDTTAINTTLRVFEPNTYCVGTSYSNYFYPTKINSYSVSNNTLTVNSDTGYAVGFAIKVAAETTYFISASITNDGRIGVAYYDSTGQWISGETNKQNKSFTTPANTDIAVLCFNSPSNQTEVSYSNIQLEIGSAATAYEPYENICPISGWTELEAYRTEKSLVRFADSVGPTNRLYNGFSGWSLDGYWKIPDRTQTYTYSVYIDNKNAENDSCINVWFRNETNTSYVRTVNGSKIKAGEEGWSTLSFNNNDYYFAGLGISLQTGGIAKSGMLEIGDAATTYESYNGTTIPITIPSVINLLNSTAITVNKTLSSTGEETSESGMSLTNYIKVNEGDIYKLTFTSKEGARTRRIYGYDVNKDPVESLASASWVTVDTVGTIQATIPSGVEYIKVCYKTADENIFLEGPESSVIYGGYVDLINGEIVQEWRTITIDETTPMRNYTADARNQGTYCEASYWLSTFNAPNAAGYEPYSTDGYCNVLPYIENNYSSEARVSASNSVSSVCLSGVKTQEEYLAWITEHGPVVICYRLATPIHYSLTPTTLKTLRGTNNIWSNSNGDITVQFWKH